MIDTILFDLGNTLVRYYTRAEWPAVRRRCIEGVRDVLLARGLIEGEPADLWERVDVEARDSPDWRVRPLEGRLSRLFGTDEAASDEACRAFMAPIFALAEVYDDALPTLSELRRRGVRTAVVSNSPWGSPARLWREELARLALADAVDAAFFCGDCGWRKPAPQIFDHVLGRLGVTADRCLFVGDDPRWDIAGPQGVGMRAVLIDRSGAAQGAVRSLAEVVEVALGARS